MHRNGILIYECTVMLDIANVDEYQPSELGFRQLVLPPGHTDVIEALIKTRKAPGKGTPGKETFTADIVKGKGKGLIILLHGAPGVGKTSTAGGYLSLFFISRIVLTKNANRVCC